MGEISYDAPPLPYANFLRNILGEENAAGWPLNSTSLVLESSRLVKSGAGTLYGFSVFSNRLSAQFVQLFDATALPANGSVPAFVMSIGAQTDKGVSWSDVGRFFQQGIVLCNSSTAATLTLGSPDCFYDAQYL